MQQETRTETANAEFEFHTKATRIENARRREVANARMDLSNLPTCIENVRKAVLTNFQGPEDATDYDQLRGRLEAAKGKFSPRYQEVVVEPFIHKLGKLGRQGFTDILLRDSMRNNTARLMLDIAQAILQNAEGYKALATDAFQEVVSDLYDGFLSAEDRGGIHPPDLSVVPAVVKWGEPDSGPYTWPIDATSALGLEAAVVSVPPIHAETGLLAWSSISHEVCGHDILHADIGLINQLAEAVKAALHEKNIDYGLPEYWSSRIDETASDVLGVLNLGPAAAIGLVGYFRGMNAAFTGKAQLRNNGPAQDPHPADILRGYLGAYSTGLLVFEQAGEWEKVIEAETDKDLTSIRLAGTMVNTDIAKQSARIVANAIMKTKLKSLENHSLDQIQNWRDRDESISAFLRTLLRTTGSLTEEYKTGFYAAHVVAAAITEALSQDVDIDVVFNRMITLLKVMHDTNPAWGPLFINHSGDIVRHLVYYPSDESTIVLH
ncbi:MAG: hypothetical protein H6Q73_4175 [Firmicutes bacterium]|nr:hypothetical protein [Bacillota bacterium]